VQKKTISHLSGKCRADPDLHIITVISFRR